jgi:hypothetical protein
LISEALVSEGRRQKAEGRRQKEKPGKSRVSDAVNRHFIYTVEH